MAHAPPASLETRLEELARRIRADGPTLDLLEEVALLEDRAALDSPELEAALEDVSFVELTELAAAGRGGRLVPRVLARQARRFAPARASVLWTDRKGTSWFEYPEADLVVPVAPPEREELGPVEPIRPGLTRWELAAEPFLPRKMGFRMGQSYRSEIPPEFLEPLRKDGRSLTWWPKARAWSVSASYFEDTPYALHAFSLTLAFRPGTGEMEIHTVADYE